MHLFSSGKIQVFIQVGGYLPFGAWGGGVVLAGLGELREGRRGDTPPLPPISEQLSLLTCSTWSGCYVGSKPSQNEP